MQEPNSARDATRELIRALRTARVRHVRNPRSNPRQACVIASRMLPLGAQLEAAAEVQSWPNYTATPLLNLPGIADAARVGRVWLKDESPRFGLGSFKALGGAYAVGWFAARRMEARTSRNGKNLQTFTCATDGNHGRAVAWGARRLGCRSVVYLHPGVSVGREAALRALGAEIVRVAGTYDDSVREAASAAAANGWILVGDTSDNDQDPSPALVMAGYTVLVEECVDQLKQSARPTHIFIQSGVGGLAAAIIAGVCRRWPAQTPLFVTVEPTLAPCVLRSLDAARRVTVEGQLNTVMAGLACGEVSCLAWPTLEAGVSHALAIDDDIVPLAMRVMFKGVSGDPAVRCGESGVAGIAALLAVAGDEELRGSLGLSADSRVLTINTEGATDPAIFAALVPEASEQS
jgi:diaminopropionate ammonia-lyase